MLCCMLVAAQLTGYIRGKPLSVNQLVHLTGIGTFQMATITKGLGEPCPFKTGASAREGKPPHPPITHLPTSGYPS